MEEINEFKNLIQSVIKLSLITYNMPKHMRMIKENHSF